MFRYWSLLSKWKQNVLIWSTYNRNESKTFWFGPKQFLLQADHFCFGPKILGQSKGIWFDLEIVLGKIEHFYIIQKLIDRSKTLWFDPLIIGTKAKRFDLVRLLSERKNKKLIWIASMLFLRSRWLNLIAFLLWES